MCWLPEAVSEQQKGERGVSFLYRLNSLHVCLEWKNLDQKSPREGMLLNLQSIKIGLFWIDQDKVPHPQKPPQCGNFLHYRLHAS